MASENMLTSVKEDEDAQEVKVMFDGDGEPELQVRGGKKVKREAKPETKQEMDLRMACEDASGKPFQGDVILSPSKGLKKEIKMELVLENDVEGSAYLDKVKQARLVIPKMSDEQIAEAVGGAGRTPRSCRSKVTSYAVDNVVNLDNDDDEIEEVMEKSTPATKGKPRGRPKKNVESSTASVVAGDKTPTVKEPAQKRKKNDVCTDLPSARKAKAAAAKKKKRSEESEDEEEEELDDDGSDEDFSASGRKANGKAKGKSKGKGKGKGNGKDADEDFEMEEEEEEEDEEEEDEEDEDEDYDEDDEEENGKRKKKAGRRKPRKSGGGRKSSGSGDGGDSAAGEDDDESTRPEILKDNPHYRVGRFVVRKKDVTPVNESFPVWKIESGMLLHKYTPFVENNALHHKATSSFNTLLYKTTEYIPIEVAEVQQGVVKVESKYQPTLPDLDNDNLFTPFKRYLNALIGQVCDPNHFEKLRTGKDAHYLTEIDKLIAEKLQEAEERYEWSPSFKELVKQKPVLQLCSKGPLKGKNMCQACPVSVSARQHPAKTTITLLGEVGDPDKPVVTSASSNKDDGLSICLEARWHLPLFHGLTHLRYHLLEKCHQKVTELTAAGAARKHASLAEACCGDREWVHERLRELKHLFNGCPEVQRS